MNMQSGFIKWLGVLVFFIGTAIGLSLSGLMTWGEMEASLAVTLPDSKSLTMTCPRMLSPTETGTIAAEIVNETDKEVKPVVTAGFGKPESLEQEQVTQTFILAPGEKKTAQWPVDASHSAFGRIVPVAIVQSRYSHNPPRWGACGILLFSLFGLNGAGTLALIIAASILFLGLGIFLTRPFFVSQGDAAKNVRQLGVMLTLLTIAALTSSLLRWWGLTILLETLSAITLGTVLTDIVLLPHKASQ